MVLFTLDDVKIAKDELILHLEYSINRTNNMCCTWLSLYLQMNSSKTIDTIRKKYVA